MLVELSFRRNESDTAVVWGARFEMTDVTELLKANADLLRLPAYSKAQYSAPPMAAPRARRRHTCAREAVNPVERPGDTVSALRQPSPRREHYCSDSSRETRRGHVSAATLKYTSSR